MALTVFNSLAAGPVGWPGLRTLLEMGILFFGVLGVFALLRWRAAILVTLILLGVGLGISFHEFFVEDSWRLAILQEEGVDYFFVEFLAWLGPMMLGAVWYLRLKDLPGRLWIGEIFNF